jgi:hypothetical protein
VAAAVVVIWVVAAATAAAVTGKFVAASPRTARLLRQAGFFRIFKAE